MYAANVQQALTHTKRVCRQLIASQNNKQFEIYPGVPFEIHVPGRRLFTSFWSKIENASCPLRLQIQSNLDYENNNKNIEENNN